MELNGYPPWRDTDRFRTPDGYLAIYRARMERYVLRTPRPRARRLWHPVGCACRLQIQSAEEGAVTIDLNREAGKVRAEGAKLAGGAGSATARLPSATWRATFY